MLFPWPVSHIPKDHLFVACFPKSGSTYLAKVLCAITGFKMRHVCATFGQNDQDICEHKLRRLSRRCVIQQHVKGTNNNLALMKQYGVRPILLVRNLYDTIVSLDDHLRREDHRMPTGYVHREYAELSFHDRIDFLIRIHLPWYFNFYMSWREAASELDTLSVTYEQLFANLPETLEQVLAFYSIAVDAQQITTAVESMRHANTRLNKGISGRGEALLDRQHKAAIAQLASVWRIDLAEMASIGLPSLKLKAAA